MTTTMTPEQIQAAALERRARLLKFHTAYLAEVREAAPTWVDMSEDMHEVVHDARACELLAEPPRMMVICVGSGQAAPQPCIALSRLRLAMWIEITKSTK